ncbi:MAG: tRNA (N6-threonylcarbamoyladenosine(37)-N6)-methyltransferase TrmO [Clostridiales bacterium]|nr:tRNA (N6-threonylcarbamoyladenosine(37)-N6)-methyltransferase TrmO [Clostridiales bacterium]
MRQIDVIAHIRTDFNTKFGIPRQSGIIDSLKAEIRFTPKYRDPSALRGLEGFSHLWLIWEFSEAIREEWSPTIRPPRLGGNKRMGVFATRSPFRPNPIGLSCVRIESIDLNTPDGPVIRVTGADLMDGTPIYDIKPYVPYADCHPDALGGFSDDVREYALEVDFPEDLLARMPEDKRTAIIEVLAQDPRPGYRHNDPDRVFGVAFAGYDIRFKVEENVLRVVDVVKG